jgi:hypothetical protein
LEDPFCGFCAVLDLGEQLRLDPDSLVRNSLHERLRFPDEGFQTLAQLGRRDLVEDVVNLAGVD